MTYYTNSEALRICAKVTAKRGRKHNLLDLFCKVTPNEGKPYFMPNRRMEDMDDAVKELGINGQRLVFPEPTAKQDQSVWAGNKASGWRTQNHQGVGRRGKMVV